MDTRNDDVKSNMKPRSLCDSYLLSLPALDCGNSNTMSILDSPTVTRLRKMGRGLIKHPDQTPFRRSSLSHTFHKTVTLSESRLDTTYSRRNSILKVGDLEGSFSQLVSPSSPSNTKKPSPKPHRPSRKPKVSKFLVENTPDTNGHPIVPSSHIESDGSAILLKGERNQSPSQNPQQGHGWRRPMISACNTPLQKGGFASDSPVSSSSTRRLSTFASNNAAGRSSVSPESTANGTPQIKTSSRRDSTVSFGTPTKLDDVKLTQSDISTQRLTRVQSKISMTTEIMNEVKRHTRVVPYVRTDQERYKEILQMEQSKLILLIGRKFNLERNIEAVLDAFEMDMSHKLDASIKHKDSKDYAPSSSRPYSAPKGNINRRRASVYLYRSEEIRRLNQLNNAFLSDLVRDNFNVKSLHRLIESLEIQLRNVCKRAGIDVPDQVSLTEEKKNSIRMAKSNLNDIRWQIESMDLGLNTNIELPDDLTSVFITEPLLSNDLSPSAITRDHRMNHVPYRPHDTPKTKLNLSPPKLAGTTDHLIPLSSTKPHQPTSEDGGLDRTDGSIQFVQPTEPSVVGFSLLEESTLYDRAGVGSLKLLGFMFDAIAAAQVADSIKRQRPLLTSAADTSKSSGGEDSLQMFQMPNSCPLRTDSSNHASPVSLHEIPSIISPEPGIPCEPNVNTSPGSTINLHPDSSGVKEAKHPTKFGDTLSPLYFCRSSYLDHKNGAASSQSFGSGSAAHINNGYTQSMAHVSTLRPNLVHDLKQLYKEYDYSRLIEDRRLFQKRLSSYRNANETAYIAELDERIRRSKMLALEGQKGRGAQNETDEISNRIALMGTIGAASSTQHSSLTSRERMRASSSYARSQSGAAGAQIRNLDMYLEDQQIAQEVFPLDLGQTEDEEIIHPTELASESDMHKESKLVQEGIEGSQHYSPGESLLQNQEEILLSTQIPCGLYFTVTRKLQPDVVSSTKKKEKGKKKAKKKSKPQQSPDGNATEDTTQVLCVRARNENSNTPCEASVKLLTEQQSNIRMLPSNYSNLSKSDGLIEMLLEPGETKTLAFLYPVNKNMPVQFNETLTFNGSMVSLFDKFNSLRPLSSRRNSDNFSIFSGDMKKPSKPLKTKNESDKGTKHRLSRAKKMSTTSKGRRALSKSGASRVKGTSESSLTFTSETEKSSKLLISVEDSKNGATRPSISDSKKVSPRMGKSYDSVEAAQILDGVSAGVDIIDNLLQPREVGDWGIPHEQHEKEAVENNMVLLSVLQTQAESGSKSGPFAENDSQMRSDVENVLQRMSLSEKNPLKDLQTAETIVTGIVQQIAEDVEAESAERFFGLEITQDAVRNRLSATELTPELKGLFNDIDATQRFREPYVKLGGLQGKDLSISYSASPKSIAPTSQLESSEFPLSSDTQRIGVYVKHHKSLSAAERFDSLSERTNSSSGRALLLFSDAETIAAPSSSDPLSQDNRVEVNADAKGQGRPRSHKGSLSSQKSGFARKGTYSTVHSAAAPLPSREVTPRRKRTNTVRQLYEFNKNLSENDMQQQLTNALKEITQNAPEAYVSRSEATGKLNVLMPSNFISDASQLSNLLVPGNVTKRVDGFGNIIAKPGARMHTPRIERGLSRVSAKTQESNKSAGSNECTTYVSNILNMVKSSALNQQPVSAKAARGVMDIAANDILNFDDAGSIVQSATTMENLEEEARLLYIQDPVRYDAVVDEFMGLITSELQESSDLQDSDGNKEDRIDGFLTDTMKVLIKKFFDQKATEDDKVPTVPSSASSLPGALPSVQKTLLLERGRSSVVNLDGSERQSSGPQLSNLALDLPSSRRTWSLLPTTDNKLRDGAIKYDDSTTIAPNEGFAIHPPTPPSPRQHPREEYIAVKVEPSSKVHTMNDDPGDIRHILYEQFKAKLILSIFVSHTRRMWALKQKEDRNHNFEVIAKTITRTTQVAWEFEKHRVLQLKKLIHILDRQTGRRKGWIPYYTDHNVLVMQDVHVPCPRYMYFQGHQRLRQAMWFARRGKILPLRLVRQDMVQSWNKHLLLGYSKYVVNDEQMTEPQKWTTRGKFIPIHYYNMRTPGERARYARRARFGAVFQFPSKRFSPRTYRERDLPVALH
ncbi:unnamed protein product [Phytomonas sp. Hart1]|nr:unnamed protein product [Phytomonas sp. Hart1]|eukprot:CCW68657.1 unnamed protein product [Phytomonas sp. isolate Hart1]